MEVFVFFGPWDGRFATQNPFPEIALLWDGKQTKPHFWVGVGTLVKSSEVYVGEGGVFLRLPGKHLSR